MSYEGDSLARARAAARSLLDRAMPPSRYATLWCCRGCGRLEPATLDRHGSEPIAAVDAALGFCSRACAEHHLDPAFVAELYMDDPTGTPPVREGR